MMERKMNDSKDDEVNKNAPVVDGFDGVENDGVEGDEGKPSNARVIQGKLLEFTIDYRWLANDEEFPKTRELVVVDTTRIVQKWINNLPAGVIFVETHQKWPNVDKLNEDCPRSEWGLDYNKKTPKGPWQKTRVAYLVDPKTMERFTWPTRTVGGEVCIREFRESVRLMRQFRGAHVYPIVTLTDTFMPTTWGGRQRPDLKIEDWIVLGREGPALPAPSAPPLAPAASVQVDQTKPVNSQNGMRTVEPPSLKEQMGDDEIPFDGSAAGRPATVR
jgi:hypothetical protein